MGFVESGNTENVPMFFYYMKKENLDEAESLALKAIELNPSKKELYQDTLDKILKLKGK